jgi:radical SAM superfamily enzyme with C-terminal helix-hairpin-helix motif
MAVAMKNRPDNVRSGVRHPLADFAQTSYAKYSTVHIAYQVMVFCELRRTGSCSAVWSGHCRCGKEPAHGDPCWRTHRKVRSDG